MKKRVIKCEPCLVRDLVTAPGPLGPGSLRPWAPGPGSLRPIGLEAPLGSQGETPPGIPGTPLGSQGPPLGPQG